MISIRLLKVKYNYKTVNGIGLLVESLEVLTDQDVLLDTQMVNQLMKSIMLLYIIGTQTLDVKNQLVLVLNTFIL